jgi:hypothetical protein
MKSVTWTLGIACAALGTTSLAHAQDAPTVLQQADEPAVISVWGKRENELGKAKSASEGFVTYADYSLRPLLRPGELAEVVPGLAATQHSGEGKANQYFLRGFNLDHGTDFSISLDGVPLNLRTNAHGQGYLDINLLTPELISSIAYRKGTYYADVGDFSAAGTAAFRSFSALKQSYVQVQAGSYDYSRFVGAFRFGSQGYIAGDYTQNNGPWTANEDLHKLSLNAHYIVGDWTLNGLAYDARWNSADQIPQRAVTSGALSPLGVVDPTDGGKTQRIILSARRLKADDDTVVYVQTYRLNLWSNFTYFLDDPVNGDQFEQAERRTIIGGSKSHAWVIGPEWTLRAGADIRYDDIGKIGLYRTEARRVLSTVRQDQVQQLSGGVWSSLDWQSGKWRSSLALRLDGLQDKVAAENPINSGSKSATLISPKWTLAYAPAEHWELYADLGRGFHSNDARGALTRVSPVSGDPVAPSPVYAAGTGGEIGGRYERPGLSATLTAWSLDLDSELVYSGDAGDTESSAASRRRGVEFLINASPAHWLNLDATWSATHARYVTGERIPNALEYVTTAGATIRPTAKDTIEFTVRHLGPSPLIEDNSARSKSSTLVNAAYVHNFGKVAATIDVLNLFDRRDNDITYFYTSRLLGEAVAGVDDYHFHLQEPRQVRVGLKVLL